MIPYLLAPPFLFFFCSFSSTPIIPSLLPPPFLFFFCSFSPTSMIPSLLPPHFLFFFCSFNFFIFLNILISKNKKNNKIIIITKIKIINKKLLFGVYKNTLPERRAQVVDELTLDKQERRVEDAIRKETECQRR